MFPLVEFPEIVQYYAPFFEGVFSADAFIEFKRYIFQDAKVEFDQSVYSSFAQNGKDYEELLINAA
jgi:hypothetical protein